MPQIIEDVAAKTLNEYMPNEPYTVGSKFTYYGHLFTVTQEFANEPTPVWDYIRVMDLGTGLFYKRDIPVPSINRDWTHIATIQTYKQGHIIFGGYRGGQQCGATIRFSATYDRAALSIEWSAYASELLTGLLFHQPTEGAAWEVYIESTAGTKSVWEMQVEINASGGIASVPSDDRCLMPAVSEWAGKPSAGFADVELEMSVDVGDHRAHNFGSFVSSMEMGILRDVGIRHPSGAHAPAFQYLPHTKDIGKVAHIEYSLQYHVGGGTPDKIPYWGRTTGLADNKTFVGRSGVRENLQFTVCGMMQVVLPNALIVCEVRCDNHDFILKDDYDGGCSAVRITIMD
ncbi:MAG TPA: hypothetical protein ENK70_02090 [Methylophaga sp.]|nr:hypothetical protein [Methylophaga sp.]